MDATYEGDLIAAAGIPFFVGRESASKYDNEVGAGKIYKYWDGGEAPGSTHEGDDAIQSYNYRLTLTADPALARPVAQPAAYNRTEYLSLVGDIITGCSTAVEVKDVCPATPGNGSAPPSLPRQPNGMARLVSLTTLPNGKWDGNNQHLGLISTDLPEENWAYPTATWAWRDAFAARLRTYTLGLIYFAQHDEAVPAWFRRDVRAWGLAGDEYADNGHFPRQVYVREARRMHGQYVFTSKDALPAAAGRRPPVHADSVTASHYALDSHAVRKREPGRGLLDGMLSIKSTRPYTVPYRVIVPRQAGAPVANVWAPVPVSGSHIGFSTLRMEPCWMALGQAAGAAAAQLLADDAAGARTVYDVDVARLQATLLGQGAVLVYDPAWAKLGLKERAAKELKFLADNAVVENPIKTGNVASKPANAPSGTSAASSLAGRHWVHSVMAVAVSVAGACLWG